MQNATTPPLMVMPPQKLHAYEAIDVSRLSPFQKILLVTDGTLTDIVEICVNEPIHVVKLSEEFLTTNQDIPLLELPKGSQIIDRKVVLQGTSSQRNFVYAETILVPERLDIEMRQSLMEAHTPLGRIWLKHRMETFKEMVHVGYEPVSYTGSYFQSAPDAVLLSRSYRVFSGSRPVMLISEKFPETYFGEPMLTGRASPS